MNKESMLSVIMPACNEALNLSATIGEIQKTLNEEAIPFEVIVIDDHSCDALEAVVSKLHSQDCRIRCVFNDYPRGFGFAVRKGLEVFEGNIVAIVMADGSDDVIDIVKYYRKIEKGYDCVFGTRFCRSATVVNYPFHKLVLNRLANLFIKMLFLIPYNDITNAFKCYHRKVIEGLRPLIACHFNLTVEMPLKAIVRGYKWTVIPTNWYGRKRGISKWNISEFGSRYLFIVIYVWLEKILTRGDYHRNKYWLNRKS